MLHPDGARVTVLMRVPILERDVLGGHFDEKSPRFGQTPG